MVHVLPMSASTFMGIVGVTPRGTVADQQPFDCRA